MVAFLRLSFLSEGVDVCEQKEACVREKVSDGPQAMGQELSICLLNE